MLGLAAVENLCHAAEGALNQPNPRRLSDELFAMKDWLTKAFDAYAGKAASPPAWEKVLPQLKAIQGEGATASAENLDAQTSGADPGAAEESLPTEGESSPGVVPDDPAPSSGFQLSADPELLAEFINESREHLESADLNLLTLETDPEDEEAIGLGAVDKDNIVPLSRIARKIIALAEEHSRPTSLTAS